jgi:hypothetical protein
METTFQYLRTHATELGSRILETYPPLQGTKDPVAPRIATLLRKALPAQALAITGTAKYLRNSQGSADRGRVRCGQDLYGAGNDPCTGGGAAQHHAGDVPFAHYAQVGA